MGKPILYGTTLSPPVRAVLLTIKAIDLDIEFKEINVQKKEHMNDEFLKKNPQHTIPVLEDDGKYIWDSHAIATYLITKYGKDDSLYPSDFYQRAMVNQRLHFDSGILFPRLKSVAMNIFQKHDTNFSKEQIDDIYEAYNFVEKFLENSNYLVGNSITIADFCCIATITSLIGIVPLNYLNYPKISAWIHRISQLPYYKEANGNGVTVLVNTFNKIITELKQK